MLQEAVNASRNRQGDILELTCNGSVCLSLPAHSMLHTTGPAPLIVPNVHMNTCQPVTLSTAYSMDTSTVCIVPLFVFVHAS